MTEESAAEGRLLGVENLVVRYRTPAVGLFESPKVFTAVNGVSFQIGRGQTLGLVGESGSGKSTVAKALLRLVQIDEGRIYFDDTEVSSLGESAFRPFRRRIQTIFQDPYASLDPRQTIGSIIAEPLLTHERSVTNGDVREVVAQLLQKVGLPRDSANRYPHQFSGGQRQRVGIARALSCRPDLIICDECVSALDVSVQAQIVNLLQDLQDEFGLSFLFISHDLAIVEHMSHHVMVMRSGELVEYASAAEIYRSPKHEYTQMLLEAVPSLPNI